MVMRLHARIALPDAAFPAVIPQAQRLEVSVAHDLRRLDDEVDVAVDQSPTGIGQPRQDLDDHPGRVGRERSARAGR
jgi:hypothetical protein